MILIPQFYLKNGKVALKPGSTSPIFSEDPVATAIAMQDAGVERLHINDLSVPHVGTSPGLPAIKEIRKQTKLIVSVDGAFRTLQTVKEYLATGLEFVALGHIAYQQPQFVKELCDECKGKIAVHIDVRGGKVTIPGYAVATNKSALDYAEQFLEKGVRYILYSDTRTDGTLANENFTSTLNFCKKVNARIVCTSEVMNNEDIERIFTLGAPRLEGLILAKSLFEDRIELRSAIVMSNDLVIASGNEATLAEI
jgi:phosphoribosylformimino-5-aminoimidazole carboxamide ribotide isomerase